MVHFSIFLGPEGLERRCFLAADRRDSHGRVIPSQIRQLAWIVRAMMLAGASIAVNAAVTTRKAVGFLKEVANIEESAAK